MKKLIVIFVGIIFMVISCGKKVDTANPDFVGEWVWVHGNDKNIITIESDSKATYQECFNCAGPSCDCDQPETGRARIKDGKLHISITKWNISEMPTKTGPYSWEMGLDGHTYVR